MGKGQRFMFFKQGSHLPPYRQAGTLSREQFQSLLADCMRGEASVVQEELRLLGSSADKVGFGYWIGKTHETQENCGCPLASICDWVTDKGELVVMAEAGIKSIVQIKRNFPNLWDEKMLRHTGKFSGWVDIVD